MPEMFYTGSRVYGTPRPDSDVDVVIRASESIFDLDMLADSRAGSGGSLRFGNLNLIVLDDDEFDRWYLITEQLYMRRPVTKEEAIAAFRAGGVVSFQAEQATDQWI